MFTIRAQSIDPFRQPFGLPPSPTRTACAGDGVFGGCLWQHLIRRYGRCVVVYRSRPGSAKRQRYGLYLPSPLRRYGAATWGEWQCAPRTDGRGLNLTAAHRSRQSTTLPIRAQSIDPFRQPFGLPPSPTRTACAGDGVFGGCLWQHLIRHYGRCVAGRPYGCNKSCNPAETAAFFRSLTKHISFFKFYMN